MPTLKLSELNEFISCPVCQGYLIDATTVSECLHTFCKSCIIKHIKNDNNECPKCNTVIHERRPLDYIVHDRNKQDIVYKLVPQLYISELKKRIASRDPHIDDITKFLVQKKFLHVALVMKESNLNNHNDNNIHVNNYTNTTDDDDCIETKPETDKPSTTNQQTNAQQTRKPSPTIFLKCPFTVTVSCLRKLLIMKYQLQANDRITLLYKGDIVSDEDLVSNLAQSLSFRFHYQISRLTSKEKETSDDLYVSCSHKRKIIRHDSRDNQHDDDEDDEEEQVNVVKHQGPNQSIRL